MCFVMITDFPCAFALHRKRDWGAVSSLSTENKMQRVKCMHADVCKYAMSAMLSKKKE